VSEKCIILPEKDKVVKQTHFVENKRKYAGFLKKSS
jgi:hypothetical protein